MASEDLTPRCSQLDPWLCAPSSFDVHETEHAAPVTPDSARGLLPADNIGGGDSKDWTVKLEEERYESATERGQLLNGYDVGISAIFNKIVASGGQLS